MSQVQAPAGVPQQGLAVASQHEQIIAKRHSHKCRDSYMLCTEEGTVVPGTAPHLEISYAQTY